MSKCKKGYHWSDKANGGKGGCVKDRSQKQEDIQNAFANPWRPWKNKK